MLKPLFLSALLLFTPSLLRAEDPVLFFDGPAHGWKIDWSLIDYDCEGRVVFFGYRKKIRYAYDVLGKKQIENPIIDLDCKYIRMISDNDGEKKWDIPKIIYYKNYRFQGDFFNNYLYNNKYNHESYDQKYNENSWFVLLLGKKKEEYSWGGGDEFSPFYNVYHTYFDYDREIKLDSDGNIYIYSKKYGFFYMIPKDMRRKIIIRDRLVYVPLQFLIKAWDRLPVCPNREKQINGMSPRIAQNCLDTFFRSLPKGDYDPDSPYPLPVQ